jgi:hypothetical protein
MGCPSSSPSSEKDQLTQEIVTLREQISTAKEVVVLTATRDALKAELHKIQTTPEASVEPTTAPVAKEESK